MAGPMDPLHDPAVLFDFSGPLFWVSVSDPRFGGGICEVLLGGRGRALACINSGSEGGLFELGQGLDCARAEGNSLKHTLEVPSLGPRRL